MTKTTLMTLSALNKSEILTKERGAIAEPNVKFLYLTISVLFFIFISLIGIELYVSNSVSTHGVEIQQLEHQKLTLTKEVQDLRQEVAQLGSLNRINKEAQSLGLAHKPAAFDFVTLSPLAQAQ